MFMEDSQFRKFTKMYRILSVLVLSPTPQQAMQMVSKWYHAFTGIAIFSTTSNFIEKHPQ